MPEAREETVRSAFFRPTEWSRERTGDPHRSTRRPLLRSYSSLQGAQQAPTQRHKEFT